MTIRIKAECWAKNAHKIKLSRKKFRLKSVKSTEIFSHKKVSSHPKNKFKQGWRDVGGKRVFFRSKWEANIGRYLEWQKQNQIIDEWFHEPQTFWFNGIKRGCVSYLPDFKVLFKDGSHEWIEVKGFMDAKSRTKIKRFRKYYPDEPLRIIGSTWYKENSKKLTLIIPEWE